MGQTEGGKWSILNDQTAAGFLYDLGRPAAEKSNRLLWMGNYAGARARNR